MADPVRHLSSLTDDRPSRRAGPYRPRLRRGRSERERLHPLTPRLFGTPLQACSSRPATASRAAGIYSAIRLSSSRSSPRARGSDRRCGVPPRGDSGHGGPKRGTETGTQLGGTETGTQLVLGRPGFRWGDRGTETGTQLVLGRPGFRWRIRANEPMMVSRDDGGPCPWRAEAPAPRRLSRTGRPAPGSSATTPPRRNIFEKTGKILPLGPQGLTSGNRAIPARSRVRFCKPEAFY